MSGLVIGFYKAKQTSVKKKSRYANPFATFALQN